MKRLVLIALLVGGFLVGCASQQDLTTIRADTVALERQSRQREREIETQLRDLQERMVRSEQQQEAARRNVARAVAANDEFRQEFQQLQGTLQEMRHQPGSMSGETYDILATQLAALETRLGSIESHFYTQSSTTTAPGNTAPVVEPVMPSFPSGTAPVAPSLSRAPQVPVSPPPLVTIPAAPPGSTPSRIARAPSKPSSVPTTTSAPRPPAPRVQPPNNAAAKPLYNRAFSDYQQGNYEVAIVLFRQLLQQYPGSSLTGKSQYWVGESLYAQKQYEAAIVAFDEVIQKYPQNQKASAAMLKQGFAFAELQDRRNARFFLQQVQKKYPNSTEAQMATEKLRQLRR